MSVIDIKNHEPPPPASSKPYHEQANDLILEYIADWRIGRAQQEIEWANWDLASKYGNLPDAHLPELTTAGLDKMLEAESRMVSYGTPYDIVAARALLGVAVEILAYQQINKEHYFAKGPVFEIVRNVLDALDWVPGKTRTCSPKHKHE